MVWWCALGKAVDASTGFLLEDDPLGLKEVNAFFSRNLFRMTELGWG